MTQIMAGILSQAPSDLVWYLQGSMPPKVRHADYTSAWIPITLRCETSSIAETATAIRGGAAIGVLILVTEVKLTQRSRDQEVTYSAQPERRHGINTCRSDGGYQTSEQSYGYKRQRHYGKDNGISRTDLEQKFL